jgi:hypothetical protein
MLGEDVLVEMLRITGAYGLVGLGAIAMAIVDAR